MEEVKTNLVSVVIPVYNEEAAIRDDIELITKSMESAGINYELIIVDDGSTDRTVAIVKEIRGVCLVQHSSNRGTGAATKTGILHAKGNIIVMTDGDGTYPNQDIPMLLEHMAEHDMVVGARTTEKGTLGWLRRPAKAFIRVLASYMVGTRIPDLNSGLRCFRKDIAVSFFPLLPSGHSWVSTITLAFLSNGHPVKYIPIDYYKRKGRSSFHPVSDTYNYLMLVMRTIMYFNPLKVMMPLCLLLLFTGLVKLIRDIIVFDFHVPGSTLIIILSGIQVGMLGLLADLIVRRTGRGY